LARTSIAYRRSPHIVSYWSATEFILHNYASRTRVSVPASLCEILNFFDRWRPIDDLFAAYPHVERRYLQRVVSALSLRTMLQRSDRRVDAREEAMQTWADWNPAAGFFHNTTKDVRFADLATITRLTRAKQKATKMPPQTKRCPAVGRIKLPRSPVSGEFCRVLLGRRTWRRFGPETIDRFRVSTLLALTSGVQSWVVTTNDEKLAIKTSPSGGARHAIETYVLAVRVEGVPPGLYHYACDVHELHLIRKGAGAQTIRDYLPTQFWFEPAAAVLLFTAVFAREQWRYDYPRAYRAVLLEAGHLCQTFCLTATWLGLAPFCTMALADSRIEKDLRVDGMSESVLYAAGVGARPSDAEWNPDSVAGTDPSTVTGRRAVRFPGRIVRQRRRR
jgi:SagB-type dehydrogenase family enzyme